jgi:hypothetical protein
VESDGRVLGFLRVIDGLRGTLPCETILKTKGISTSHIDALRTNGYRVYEVGKYALHADLNPAELKLVRNALFLWLKQSHLSDPSTLEKTVFIIDVSSAIHERGYNKMFGARTIDRAAFSPPLASPDALMEVDARTLLRNLDRILKASE